MSENINNNVIASGIKFVDFAGLDHFWSIAKAYINAEDAELVKIIDGIADVVGNDESGLVKDVKTLQTEVAALGGAEGGIQGMIDASIEDLVNNGAVKTNTDAIAELTQTVADNKSAIEGTVAELTQTVADNKSAIEGTVAELAQTVADNKSAIEGTVAGVEEKVDNHIADAVAHITADERASWNEAKTAIDTFLKDAELDAEGKNVIDTLKELQTYVGSDPATALVTRVGDLESSVSDLTQTVADNKSAIEGTVATLTQTVADNKADIEGKVATLTQTVADNKSAIESSVAELAQTVADNEADIEGKVSTLTQTVADNKADIEGKVATAKSEAIADAKAYVDGDTYKANFDAAGSAAAAGAAAESNANAYTDALYNSIVVASLSDIDSIFGVTDHNHEA